MIALLMCIFIAAFVDSAYVLKLIKLLRGSVVYFKIGTAVVPMQNIYIDLHLHDYITNVYILMQHLTIALTHYN